MRRPAATLLLVAAVLAVYWNSAGGAFVFDDVPAIVDNPHVRSLRPLSSAFAAPAEAPTAGRPIAAFSFAVSYAQGAGDPWWFHAGNVAVHLAAALALFGVVRRTLLAPPMKPLLKPAFGSAATTLAFLIALLWAVHPLHTQAVTYVVQRMESLMGLFLLLTMYWSIRAGETGRLSLLVAAWVACALGMATKQTMAGAPLLVILWDWVFAPRMRWRFYGALASTWAVLALVMIQGARPHSVGAIEGWTPASYLLTQTEVILHYVRLAFVPAPLVFDYDWPPATGVRAIVSAAVLALFVSATIAGIVRRKPWAFAPAWFLIILAPSSSLLPIATEVAAEHRMYLPLAAIVAAVVIGGAVALGEANRPRRTAAVCTVLAVALGAQTISRNRVYASDEALWADTMAKRPANARALNNYAVDLLKTGHPADAEAHARTAAALKPGMAEAHQTLGVSLLSLGRVDDGIAALERARALDPENGKTHQNLGEAYGAKGDLRMALNEFLEAARLLPDDAFVLNRAGWILATAGDPSLRDGARAVQLATHAVEVTGRRDVTSLDTLAAALAEVNDFDRAVAVAREALALARATGAAAMLPELEGRVATYERRRPFRA